MVRWVGSKTTFATDAAAPVVFDTGAIGNTMPLVMSQQYRGLLRNVETNILFGAAEVLAPALSLVALDGVRIAEGGTVTYHHIMFDNHQIAESDGVQTKSFYPGQTARNTLNHAAREELLSLFPDLHELTAFNPTAAYTLKPFEAMMLVSVMR